MVCGIFTQVLHSVGVGPGEWSQTVVKGLMVRPREELRKNKEAKKEGKKKGQCSTVRSSSDYFTYPGKFFSDQATPVVAHHPSSLSPQSSYTPSPLSV